MNAFSNEGAFRMQMAAGHIQPQTSYRRPLRRRFIRSTITIQHVVCTYVSSTVGWSIASIYDLGAHATYVCMYICKCMLQLMYLHTVRTVYINPEVTCIGCVPPYVCTYYMYSIHMSWFHPLPLCSPGMVTGRVGR